MAKNPDQKRSVSLGDGAAGTLHVKAQVVT